MGYIPKDAKWYIAELVAEFTIEGEANNVVYIDTTLIRAASPEEAFERAVSIGREGESCYMNAEGKSVRRAFRGLRNLDVVDGELEHGTELLFERRDGISQSELEELIRPREELNVFRPTKSYHEE